MKRSNLFVPVLVAVAALFAGTASAADEKEDILARFDRELLLVMSGFAEARESAVSSSFRQSYISSLDRFVNDANTLQKTIQDLGIGEDLAPATHARNIRTAFQQTPAQNTASTNSNTRNNSKNNGKSNVAKANDPLSRITGQSLSDYAGLGTSSGGTGAANQSSSAGFSFHMAGNTVQTLSALGFAVRNGKYSVSPRCRNILPYLEFKRDVDYFNASYEHFDSLIEIPVWRTDFEKRLKRMSKLAIQIQPVYRAYFPGKTLSATTEAERLSRVYSRFIEYVKATDEAQKGSERLNDNHKAFDQIRQSSIPDKGLILKDYDTAASKLAEFFADMDSVDWTVKPFSADASPADGTVKIPSKSAN
jgi:hypothetical protein